MNLLDRRELALREFAQAAAGATIVSFDIFDTLLLRPFKRPVDLFAALAAELDGADAGLKRHFPAWREAAERTTRAAAAARGQQEVSLESIYATLGDKLARSGRTSPAVADLMALELALELRVVRADLQVLALYRNLQAAGARIVLVSDMYLPEHQIRALLDSGGVAGFERLYLSSSTGFSKASGSVWDHIREDLRLDRADVIVHLGDNAHADGSVAARHGIRSFLLPSPELRSSISRFHQPGSWVTDMLVAINHQNLTSGRFDGTDPYWVSLATTVVLPAAIGMARFVHELADERNLGNVVFLARDGLVFKRAYDALYARDGATSRYLWSSRRCLNLPGIERIDARALDFLMSHDEGMTVADYLNRIDLDPASPAVRAAIASGFDDSQYRVRTAADRTRVRAVLARLAPQILDRAMQERTALHRHLADSRILDEPTLVVDLGWHGSLQRSLSTLVQQLSGQEPRIEGAYLGTFATADSSYPAAAPSHGWLFERGAPMRIARGFSDRAVEIPELLFSAPEHGIRHLELRAEGCQPVRAIDPNERMRIELAALFHRIVEEGAHEIAPYFNAVASADLRRVTTRALLDLMRSPDAADRAHLGPILHARGFGVAHYERLIAAGARPRSLRAALAFYRRSLWGEGALGEMPVFTRQLTRVVLGCANLTRSWRRR